MSNFDPARLFTAIAAYGHNGTIGARYVAHGADWVELALDYDPGLIGDERSGILASGPIVALMDMAASSAVWVSQGRMRPQATLDLRIDYLRPSPPGLPVIGRAECYRVSRHIAFVRGTAHNGDAADPLAQVAGTFMFLDPEQAR